MTRDDEKVRLGSVYGLWATNPFPGATEPIRVSYGPMSWPEPIMPSATYPPFSGSNPPCVKCEDTREKAAKVVSYGRSMRAPNGRLMFVNVHTDAEDLHIVRSCSNCGWEWEERCADDRDGTTTIREAQA